MKIGIISFSSYLFSKVTGIIFHDQSKFNFLNETTGGNHNFFIYQDRQHVCHLLKIFDITGLNLDSLLTVSVYLRGALSAVTGRMSFPNWTTEGILVFYLSPCLSLV